MTRANTIIVGRETPRMDIQEAMAERISCADREGAGRLVDEWGGEHGFENLLEELVGPALKRIADTWEMDGDVSLSRAYIASRIVDEALEKVRAADSGNPSVSETKGPIVLGNILDDCHPLGRKIVASFLRAHRWEVRDLGYDVEASTFVDEALRIGAKVIGVSAMMYSTAENIRAVREEIDRRDMTGRLRLAVGGAVFRLRPELVGQVGGDGTARNGMDAPALFDSLWSQALLEENRADE